ncbi:RnfABCDGE type electron transport complex subunit D [Porphyromonas circumdentaria]|uniref:Ion-translocating oxidoreductase complex subunit D n=1 Tax=Porphyromonas circumdentaria TaxID=29524 RepID=A0A1T4NNQ2_9PORP|nr:RnfABCDGE type electron transport complex subunit D [Porphyromonas circumdentaria]MBB6276139.1 electron transport complex protein RnfD [Porphyromonas circumdentaria]MDO4721633.1 RnfABCDGE type electron transport complex subunit D [Porphyromonas circumdentaria]SJZ80686.1 electron transport complex protein RnfD [Porphyromonas circumdentaria]
MENRIIVSPSPHIHSGDSISKNMYGVLIALIPAFLFSVYQFGWHSLLVTAICVLTCCLTEYFITTFMLRRKNYIFDGSAILTAVLLAFNLPSTLPWWIVVIGSIIAIAIGKMAFGGLGNNIFNPALVGRVFLLIAFPAQMTTWPVVSHFAKAVDGETMATPLSFMKEAIKGTEGALEQIPSSLDLFLGLNPGSMGEISAIALLIGLVYMLARKIITWHTPISILLTVFVFSGILYLVNPSIYPSPITHLLTGGLMLGAIFMATDYVSSPITSRGQLIYGVSIGLLTVIIRTWGAYPEGMSFAILIMNAFTPIINLYFKPKHFGEKVKKVKEVAK